jgi:hypothetical protein
LPGCSSRTLNISSISVRRFIVEEWEDPSYRMNNLLNPDFYIKIFNNSNHQTVNNHDLLPFYTKNIIVIIIK